MKGRDVAGFVLGALIFSTLLPGVLILSVVLMASSFHQGIGYHLAYALLLVGVVLFVSICVAIPARSYEGEVIRNIGLAAFSMASAIAVSGVITVLGCLIGTGFYNIEDERWLIPMMIIALGLALLTFFGSCACVLAKKVQPGLAHVATGTVAGLLLAGLCGLLVYYWR